AKAGWANETPAAAIAATLNRVRTIFPSPIVLASKGNLRVVLTLTGTLDVKSGSRQCHKRETGFL
ncbi:MAG: hypothetical protein WA693_08570, partial [Pseudolabrys sp.]